MVKHGGGSVLVWGIFSANGLGPLILIEGIMNCLKYKEILENNLLPYSDNFILEEWIFQHDNDPNHTLKVVKDWLASNRIQVLKWPAQSPDLNPIENLEIERTWTSNWEPKSRNSLQDRLTQLNTCVSSHVF